MDPLDFLRERKLAFAELMGIVFVSADKDKVVAELEVTPKLCTRPTTIHGGALMAFADTLGAAGTTLNLPEGHTLESKTNFIAVRRSAPSSPAKQRRSIAAAARKCGRRGSLPRKVASSLSSPRRRWCSSQALDFSN